MKLGVLSDVHGNFEAFDAAVAAMAPNVDELLVAGDAFSDHRFSNEVIARVRAMGARYVLGTASSRFSDRRALPLVAQRGSTASTSSSSVASHCRYD